MQGKKCDLYERECIDCMECEKCDLDDNKNCDNCGKCLEENGVFRSLNIHEFIRIQEKGNRKL